MSSDTHKVTPFLRSLFAGPESDLIIRISQFTFEEGFSFAVIELHWEFLNISLLASQYSQKKYSKAFSQLTDVYKLNKTEINYIPYWVKSF